MGAIELLLTEIDETLIGFVNSVFLQLSPAVHALWRMMMILFIVIYGYRVMTSGNYEAREMFVKMLKLVIVLVIATEWAAFSLLVYDLTTQFPAEVGAQILSSQGQSSGGVNTGLTAFFDKGFLVAGEFLRKAGFSNLMYFFYGSATVFFTVLFGAYAAFLIILAKLAVALLLAVAPIFIILLVFNESRELFMGWLRTLINYALIPLFVYALLALIGAIIDDRLNKLAASLAADSAAVTVPFAAFALCTFAGFLLSLQIMNIVSGITGGYTLGTLGSVSRNAMRGARISMGAAKRTPAAMQTAKKGAIVSGGVMSDYASRISGVLKKNRTGGGA
jgi:type IV secretion system protein VirB6